MQSKRLDKARYDVVMYSYAAATSKFIDSREQDSTFLRYLTEQLSNSDQFRCVYVLK
ncbi:unnamed protein product, partial [Soboliphyme baturini]|uniref:TIR domain-containing protein n=1 Tax=Soboliphyme baturini TaxID=241478 RepID=A0A183JAT3_9BILA